mmetsp:Transcript_23841/g.41792  ORF Transcript_23841/g.41792 Transcript_23841/m.41792 type:complete len:508 (-) Transcript_23841:313-1836(-)
MADALLDDLDDLSDVEPEEEPSYEDRAEAGSSGDGGSSHDAAMCDGINGTSSSADGNAAATTKQRPRLLDDTSLKSHLSSVRAVKSGDDQKPSASDVTTKEEDEHQHVLVLASNKHLVSLGHEIHRAHLELCRQYHPKFPELEELLTETFQYRTAIGIIQNEMDVTKSNEELNEILSSNQIITISVAGSTTSGRRLTDDELKAVNACLYLDQLKSTQTDLTTFVESRMERCAPSVCALIGPFLAAQLLASTGGLAELTRIPACNLQLLGKNKSTSASRGGMATQTRAQHAGYLIECELVQSTPNYLKMKAVKAVAGKLALAARTDHVNVESGRKRTAAVGRKFHEELRVKFGKWEEPDKAQVVKALPKPDLSTKKRRGGRRIRRLKERFEETEMMKQANRRAFSAESGEYGDDAMGLTLGMLDNKEGGAMRNTVEKRKIRQANTKASRKRAVQMSSGATNGLASSMVFTPVQGLELVNPDANRERVRQANAKWFSEDAGFQSALPKK